jgi:hypothetical protein
MPIQVQCPGCGQKLRIGDALVGKRVACPKCKQAFDATAETEAPTEAVPAQPAPPPPPPAKVEDQHYDVVDDDEKPATPEPEDQDDGEVEKPRRRKTKRPRRSDVRAMVSYPANALKIVAYVGVGLNILGQLARVALIMTSPEAKENAGAYMMGSVCGLVLSVALIALWAKILIYTADCMYSLDHYGSAVAGCIAAIILPCGFGWLGGIPIGIWGLVVLCLPSVREAFLYEDAPTGNYATTSTRRLKRGSGSGLLLPLLLGIPVGLVVLCVGGYFVSRVVLSRQMTAQQQFTNVGKNIGNDFGNPPNFPNNQPVNNPPPVNNPMPPPVDLPPPVVTGDPALDKLLADLGSDQWPTVNNAAQKLATMQPNDHQAAVAQQLAARIDHPNPLARTTLARALCVWGTAKEIPVFITILDDQDFQNIQRRHEVLKIIGKFKDERTIPALLKCLKNIHTRHQAQKALQEVGPVAEKDVLPLLQTDDLRSPALKILKEIGTQQSVPALKAIAATRRGLPAREALDAIAAINVRSMK